MQTYSIYSCSQAAETAETGLTTAQVVRFIYRDDGQDYSLEAKMEKVYDEAGEDTGDEVQSTSSWGELEWSIHFKSSRGQWRYGVLTAHGATEEAAELAWLEEAFKSSRFEASKWCIQSDEDYQIELAEQRKQVEDEQK